MSQDQDDGTTFGDALPKEMARVRDHILPRYVEIGPAGMFGAAMIRANLDAAARALASGDVVAMIAAYRSLQECMG